MLSEALGPVMAFLRVTWGIRIASYMDDFLIQGFSPSQVCLHAFFPKQQATLLRFILIFVSMTVSCPLGRITWESFDGHLHGWYSHQGILLSAGALLCTWGYFTVLGSGLVPNLEEGCFFPKSSGYPFLTFTSLGFVLGDRSLASHWEYQIAAYVQECGGHCHCAWCLGCSWLTGACGFNVTFWMLLYSAFQK